MFNLGDFFRELHRRSIWQALGCYAAVAWIVLQLTETLEGSIGLPFWFGRTVIVLLVLGFLVLLITTLVEGSRRDRDEGFYGAGDDFDSFDSWKHLDDNAFKAAFRKLFTWRNWALGGVAAAALLGLGTMGYSGMRSAGLGPWGSLHAKGIFETDERLILADFEDHTEDGTLGETVTALFRIDLSQSRSLVLLERAQLSPGLVRMERDPMAPMTHDVALELAQREGVKGVVMGEVLPLGPGAVVSARLVVASSGEDLVTLRETARTIDAVPEAVDRLSAQFRERIGESFQSIRSDPPLEKVTTASTEALRKYVQAEWAVDMGDLSTAQALVKEAVALDSTFSMAYRKLGVLLSNEGGGDEAKEAFTKAYEGRDRLTTRERLLAEAAYHTYVTEDMDAAILAYEGVLEDYPTDGIAGNNLAGLYAETGDKDKAVDLYLATIERGGAPAVAYTNAVVALYDLGRSDSAAVLLDTFGAAYPDHPAKLQYASALASAHFDYPAAEAQVERLLAEQENNARWQMYGNLELASYSLIGGRMNRARENVLAAFDLQDGAGSRFFEGPRSHLETITEATIRIRFLDDPEGGVAVLDDGLRHPEVISTDQEESDYLEIASLYAAAGRPEKANQRLEAFRNEVPENERDDNDTRSRVKTTEAAIALAGGDPREAIRLLREAQETVPDCRLCGLAELGEAFEAAALPDSAAVAFEQYLERDVLFRSQFDAPRLHRVLLGLGRSYEAMNQQDRAAESYERLLSLWSGADADLQPRIEQIRSRVGTLAEEGS